MNWSSAVGLSGQDRQLYAWQQHVKVPVRAHNGSGPSSSCYRVEWCECRCTIGLCLAHLQPSNR
eukprot:scaffold187995_cov28-Tisochrysis_lutea.AAC.3